VLPVKVNDGRYYLDVTGSRKGDCAGRSMGLVGFAGYRWRSKAGEEKDNPRPPLHEDGTPWEMIGVVIVEPLKP
jgi:hypothetical protein